MKEVDNYVAQFAIRLFATFNMLLSIQPMMIELGP